MIMKKSIVIIFILYSLFPFAQTNITVSGKEIMGSNGSVSYSIGQIDYQNNQSNDFFITQGVQQPFEIFVLDTKEWNSLIDVQVFPNPTSEGIELIIYSDHPDTFSYILFDINGKQLKSNVLNSSRNYISLNELSQSVYLLTLLSNDSTYKKTFKILKN